MLKQCKQAYAITNPRLTCCGSKSQLVALKLYTHLEDGPATCTMIGQARDQVGQRFLRYCVHQGKDMHSQHVV